MHHASESSSAVCIIPQSQVIKISQKAPWWCTPRSQNRNLCESGCFSRDNQEKSLKGWTHLSWKKRFEEHFFDFLNFVIEYLGEIETDIENTLACLSGAQIGLNHEKNWGRKSRDTLPFKHSSNCELRTCELTTLVYFQLWAPYFSIVQLWAPSLSMAPLWAPNLSKVPIVSSLPLYSSNCDLPTFVKFQLWAPYLCIVPIVSSLP